MNWKKGVSLILAVILAWSSLGITYAATSAEIKKNQQQLKNVQSELKKLTQEKRQKSTEQKTIVSRINNIEDNIQGLENEISSLQSKIKGAETSVATAKTELSLAEKKITLKNSVLNARLRAMYKMGHIGYMDVLLGSSDFGDMMTRLDMLQKIYTQDTTLLKQMHSQRDQISQKKSSLEKYAKELRDLRANLGVKQSSLDQNKTALQGEIVEISKDLKALEQREDQLLEDSNRLTNILAKMQTTTKYIGGKMAWPAPGNYKISSPYGYRIHPVYKTKKLHTGVDISTPYNAKIVAAQDGTVIMSEYYFGYGKTIMIDHGGGYVTLYGHNNSLLVSVGTKVKKGQQIAKSGSTGVSTGPHCHFEVRYKGKIIDPMPWITGK